VAIHVKFTRAPFLIDRKGITRKDWAGIGIDHDDVWFDRSNSYMVDASDFPDEVMAYFKGDPDFSITTADSPTAPKEFEGRIVNRGPSGTDLRQQGFLDNDATDQEEAAERAAREAPSPSDGPTTTVGGSGTDTARGGRRR
jgi:hypothetical protein